MRQSDLNEETNEKATENAGMAVLIHCRSTAAWTFLSMHDPEKQASRQNSSTQPNYTIQSDSDGPNRAVVEVQTIGGQNALSSLSDIVWIAVNVGPVRSRHVKGKRNSGRVGLVV